MGITKRRPRHGLLFALLANGPAAAQTVTGTISGTVVDSTGSVIVGATVTLIDERTGDTRTLITTDTGDFSFAVVQPGAYTLKIELPGFRTFQRENNVLSANEHLALGKLELQLGELSETVTAVAEGTRIETESSDHTARLTSDQIELISTKGRDVTSLLRTMPGVAYTDDVETLGEGFGTDLPNITGQRGRASVVTVDGLMGNDVSGSPKLSHTINLDAVGEVKVLLNNYAAEYGNQGGAMITIVSKSGRKNYFGSGYYFGRNEALNANRFFNNRDGLLRPLYRHHIWGFNIGGPVQIPGLFPNTQRKRLFFFYSIERPHTITPTNAVRVTVPTALERQGDFSQSFSGINATTGLPVPVFIRDPIKTGFCQATPATPMPGVDYQEACFPGNKVPRERWNPSGLALLNFFPLPNQPGGRTAAGNPYNYIIQKSVDVPKLSNVLRVDFKATENDNINVKYQTWTSDNEGFGTSGWPSGDANRWGLNSHYLYEDDGVVGNWVRVISSRMVNDVTLAWRHSTEAFIPSDGVIDGLTRTKLNYTTPQLFPANNSLGIIPKVTGWGGVAGTPANINWLDRWGEVGQDYVLSFANNFSFIRRNHHIKAGVYVERLLNGEARGSNWAGTYNFGSSSALTTAGLNTNYGYANALIGNFNSYSESMTRNHTDARLLLVQWYGQDQWKMHPRMSLNYGLRLSSHTQWLQRDKLAATFASERYNPAQAPLLYVNGCTQTPIPATGCPAANRRALNPATGELFTNTQLVGAIIPGTGDLYNGMVVAGDSNYPEALKEYDGVLWEPRLGFAWDIFGKGKTVLRSMFGMYHSPRVGGGSIGNLTNNPPLNRTLTINFGNIDDLANLTGSALIRPSSANALERNAKTPAVYNFMFGIEQEIGFKTTLRVNYVGSQARFLGEERNINGLPDTTRFLDMHPANRDPVTNAVYSTDFLRPHRALTDINLVTYSGSSNYNALQVQVNRRYARAFQFGIAYTWARTMDYINDDTDAVSYNRPYRDFNYGPANHDQRQIFVLNYIWDVFDLSRRWENSVGKAVFSGWQLSGLTALVTGRPEPNLSFSVSDSGGFDFTGGSQGTRMVMTGNPNRRTGAVGPDGTPILIDTSVFARPPRAFPGAYFGNTPRNVLRLPGVINFDVALFKNMRLGEKRTLQFRWETYNIFNHTNFSDMDAAARFDPEGNQINPRFGQATQSRPARVMQGSLRISF